MLFFSVAERLKRSAGDQQHRRADDAQQVGHPWTQELGLALAQRRAEHHQVEAAAAQRAPDLAPRDWALVAVRPFTGTPLRLPRRWTSTSSEMPGRRERPRSTAVSSCGWKTCSAVTLPLLAWASARAISVASRASAVPLVGSRMSSGTSAGPAAPAPLTAIATGPSNVASSSCSRSSKWRALGRSAARGRRRRCRSRARSRVQRRRRGCPPAPHQRVASGGAVGRGPCWLRRPGRGRRTVPPACLAGTCSSTVVSICWRRGEQAGEPRRQPAVGAVVDIDQRALHLGQALRLLGFLLFQALGLVVAERHARHHPAQRGRHRPWW